MCIICVFIYIYIICTLYYIHYITFYIATFISFVLFIYMVCDTICICIMCIYMYIYIHIISYITDMKNTHTHILVGLLRFFTIAGPKMFVEIDVPFVPQ